MKIQYCSDLHLEFERNRNYLTHNPLSICGDILILAGDIVPLHDEFLNDPFFSFISDNYEKVFWVPGNHEFYYKDISEFNQSYNIKLKSNISIVNNIDLQHKNVHFVFSTLWSKISKANETKIEQSVSDFECITNNKRKLKAREFNRLHQDSLKFIKQSLLNTNGVSVVVTHHLPSVLCNSKEHKNSILNEAFCVDLTDYIERCNANFWLYGHSHFNQKPLIVGKTIMLTNQLGYVHCNEQGGYKENAYFSV